jgi:hypothetical protein
VSAGEAALGLKLSVPGQLLPRAGTTPAAPQHQVIPATRRTYAEVARGPTPLDSAGWVYVRKGGQGAPLCDNYDGPFKVLESGEKTCHVQVGGRVEVITRDRLKPHLAAEAPDAAEPPRRGRPPKKT